MIKVKLANPADAEQLLSRRRLPEEDRALNRQAVVAGSA